MVQQAIDSFGRLDTLVCNAGFLRDRMLAGMSEDEWDSVTRVHLKGHFAPARHAIEYWRDQSKAGNQIDARVVNTSSGAGLAGSIGQGNYATAKAGIALLTIQQAAEWGRYGVRCNAIAPDARTRMTEGVFYSSEIPDGFDEKAPENVSPLVVWLGSADCDVTGRIFENTAGQLNVCDGWQKGPIESVGDRRMTVAEAGRAGPPVDRRRAATAAGPRRSGLTAARWISTTRRRRPPGATECTTFLRLHAELKPERADLGQSYWAKARTPRRRPTTTPAAGPGSGRSSTRVGPGSPGRSSTAVVACRVTSPAIFAEEESRYDVPQGQFAQSIGMAGPTIIVHGTDAQKARYLAADADGRGDLVSALLRTRRRLRPGRAAHRRVSSTATRSS